MPIPLRVRNYVLTASWNGENIEISHPPELRTPQLDIVPDPSSLWNASHCGSWSLDIRHLV